MKNDEGQTNRQTFVNVELLSRMKIRFHRLPILKFCSKHPVHSSDKKQTKMEIKIPDTIQNTKQIYLYFFQIELLKGK